MIDEDSYDAAVEDATITFQQLVKDFLAGLIVLAVLRARFREALQLHYVRVMTIALNGIDPTTSQLAALDTRLAVEYTLLDGFLQDLSDGLMSESRAVWRAGLYAFNRETAVYFSVDEAVAILMESSVGLPGDICYGNGLCGCHLEVTTDSDGNAAVYWVVNPEKEHCEACLAAEAGSPYLFTAEELANA